MLSKSRIIRILGPCGGYSAIRWWMRQEPRILMFHRFSETSKEGYVSAKVFEDQLIYLKRRFNVIPLSVLRKSKEVGVKLPPNSLVLTVDDGYKDFYEVAYPILKKHRLTATLYVTTGFVNQELWLWPDKISWLLKHSEALYTEIRIGDNRVFPQKISQSARTTLWATIISFLLSVPDSSKHQWITEFARALKRDLPDTPPKDYSACTWHNLKEMQQGGIELGGHTHTHPSLGQVNDIQLKSELALCQKLLSEKLGAAERDFCFPNGQPNDYSERVVAAVKSMGFKSSVTAFYDRHATFNLFEMRRHTGSENWFQFYKSANGVEAMMAKYLNDKNTAEGALC